MDEFISSPQFTSKEQEQFLKSQGIKTTNYQQKDNQSKEETQTDSVSKEETQSASVSENKKRKLRTRNHAFMLTSWRMTTDWNASIVNFMNLLWSILKLVLRNYLSRNLLSGLKDLFIAEIKFAFVPLRTTLPQSMMMILAIFVIILWKYYQFSRK